MPVTVRSWRPACAATRSTSTINRTVYPAARGARTGVAVTAPDEVPAAVARAGMSALCVERAPNALDTAVRAALLS